MRNNEVKALAVILTGALLVAYPPLAAILPVLEAVARVL